MKRRSSSTKKRHRPWAKTLLVSLLFALTFRAFIAEAYVVPTGSMESTLLVGDHLVVDKMAYGLRIPFSELWITRGPGPRRGDIVVFKGVETPQRVLVKRVIAVGGDEVAMRDGSIIVNGRALRREPSKTPCTITLEEGRRPDLEARCQSFVEYPPGNDDGYRVQRIEGAGGDRFAALRVPPGQLFVMGDYRDLSHDSRAFGFIDEERLLGRAWALFWSRDGAMPRWSRFFTALR